MAYPPVAVGQLVTVQFVGTMFNQSVLSNFKYQISAIPGTPPGFDVAAFNLYTSLTAGGGIVPTFLACCPPQYTLSSVNIQLVYPIRYAKNVFLNGGVGTFAKTANTANLAAVITRRGAQATKSNVSSLHIPLANLDTTASGGNISTAQLTAMQTLLPLLYASITDSSNTVWAPGIFPGHITSGGQFIKLQTAFSQLTTRVMRKRTVGVGR